MPVTESTITPAGLHGLILALLNTIILILMVTFIGIGLKRHPINAGPKILAARVGLILSAGAAAFGFWGLRWPSLIMASILAFFAALEGFLGICVACRIHTFLVKVARTAVPVYLGDGDGI